MAASEVLILGLSNTSALQPAPQDENLRKPRLCFDARAEEFDTSKLPVGKSWRVS